MDLVYNSFTTDNFIYTTNFMYLMLHHICMEYSGDISSKILAYRLRKNLEKCETCLACSNFQSHSSMLPVAKVLKNDAIVYFET